jgi:hypothetical protein
LSVTIPTEIIGNGRNADRKCRNVYPGGVPRPTQPDPDGAELAAIRAAGAAAARSVHEGDAVPQAPLERVAWAAGAGTVNAVEAAVEAARAAGFTWKQIAVALDENEDNARHKYGAGYDAQRRYRQRKRSGE